jgi:S-adenosylmethionine-diacylgycerolhomoserine-N-methlytransferase
MSDAAAPAHEHQNQGDNAALMDGVYRRQRHIYDLTRKYYLLGRDRLIERLDPPTGGHVLEIGSGTGRNLIAAARAHPDATFFGVDISSEMLATARGNIRRAGLADRIMLGRGDAASFDPDALFGRARFDRVFFSYSLSMIPAWREALTHAAAMVGQDGRLLVVDFGQQERMPRWFRAGLFAWLARFHVTPRAGLPAALQAIACANRATVTPLYRGYATFAELG